VTGSTQTDGKTCIMTAPDSTEFSARRPFLWGLQSREQAIGFSSYSAFRVRLVDSVRESRSWEEEEQDVLFDARIAYPLAEAVGVTANARVRRRRMEKFVKPD
jgi:hypothetical protein